MSVDLKLLADAAAFDIIFDKCSQPGPPVVMANGVECFEFPRVASCDMIVEASCYISSEVFVLRDVVFPFEEQNCFSVKCFHRPIVELVFD